MRGWLTVARMPTAVAGVVAAVATGYATTSSALDVAPGPPVRVVWFLLLGMVVLATLPLYPSFGVLETTFVRSGLDKALRSVVSATLVVGGAATMAAVTGADAAGQWSVLLAAVTVVAAAATHDTAWLVTLIVGAATLLWEHSSPASPMTQVTDLLGWAGAVSLLGTACATFVLRQPRRRLDTASL